VPLFLLLFRLVPSDKDASSIDRRAQGREWRKALLRLFLACWAAFTCALAAAARTESTASEGDGRDVCHRSLVRTGAEDDATCWLFFKEGSIKCLSTY